MQYVKKCEQCDIEFTSEKPATYCSGKCRVTAHRSVTAEPNSVTADGNPVTAEFKSNAKLLEERIVGKYKIEEITVELLNKVCPDAQYQFTFIPNWLKTSTTLKNALHQI